MDGTLSYTPTERKALVGAKVITVRSLTPVFKTSEDRESASQKVQDGLYRVFHKYMIGSAG